MVVTAAWREGSAEWPGMLLGKGLPTRLALKCPSHLPCGCFVLGFRRDGVSLRKLGSLIRYTTQSGVKVQKGSNRRFPCCICLYFLNYHGPGCVLSLSSGASLLVPFPDTASSPSSLTRLMCPWAEHIWPGYAYPPLILRYCQQPVGNYALTFLNSLPGAMKIVSRSGWCEKWLQAASHRLL